MYQPIGYTEGYGHFHFSDAVFEELAAFVAEDETARSNRYGMDRIGRFARSARLLSGSG
jgi:hypothetical protein